MRSCLLALCLAGAIVPRADAQVGFDNVRTALDEQDYLGALELCDAIDDPLLALQSRFHVLHHGGDLHGALLVGRECLERYPSDIYMLDQVCYVAGTLGALGEMERRTAELEALSTGGQAEAVAPILERHRALLAELRENRARSRSSRTRARAATSLLGALTLIALLGLSRSKG